MFHQNINKNAIILVLTFKEKSRQPALSSPSRLGIQGGPLSITDEGGGGGAQKSSCLILDSFQVSLDYNAGFQSLLAGAVMAKRGLGEWGEGEVRGKSRQD